MAFKTEDLDKAKEFVSSLSEPEKAEFTRRYASLKDDSQREKVISNVLSRIGTTNKEAQVTTSASPNLNDTLKKRMSEVDVDVKSRGDYLEGMAKNLESPSVPRKILGGIQGVAIPSVALESGLSNPMLAMQRGSFNPLELGKEAYLGATLQKQGQYGDVYRGAIPSPTLGKVVGSIVGLGLSVAGPIQTFKALKNSFGDVSKMSDKILKNAGESIIKSADEAEKFVGESISKAYDKLNPILVDGNSWTRVTENIPKAVKEEVTRTIGDFDTLLPTVENLRKIKTLLGKYRPGDFGKDARGLAENIEVAKIDEAYSGIKSVLSNTIAKKIGAKNTSALLELDNTASSVYRATNELKNAVTNPRLLLPTRGGKVAKGLTDSGDISTREAMNIIRSGGGKQARKIMNKAINALDRFNSREIAWKVAGRIVGSATYGGAIGAAGGTVFNKVSGRQNSDT